MCKWLNIWGLKYYIRSFSHTCLFQDLLLQSPSVFPWELSGEGERCASCSPSAKRSTWSRNNLPCAGFLLLFPQACSFCRSLAGWKDLHQPLWHPLVGRKVDVKHSSGKEAVPSANWQRASAGTSCRREIIHSFCRSPYWESLSQSLQGLPSCACCSPGAQRGLGV